MAQEKLVAIIKDTKGKCKYFAYVKRASENEINKLINEQNEYEQRVLKDMKDMLDRIAYLENEIKLFKGE